MADQILARIREETEQFDHHSIVVTKGYDFNQQDCIRKIDLYFASRFVRHHRDDDNFKKLFFNIIKSRVNTATKQIDLDTKDIQIKAVEGQSFFPAWFFEKELKQFMKDEKFGILLNDMVEKLPRYGSIVIKDVQGKPKIVQLQNLVLDPTVATIQESPYVIEKHVFSIEEFEAKARAMGWENVEEVINLYEDKDEPMIQVVERYGYATSDEINGDGENTQIKSRVIVAGIEFTPEDTEIRTVNEQDYIAQPVVLNAVEVDEWPYRDIHWEKEDGRWLGVGVVEDLFINQESTNELVNLQRKSLYWSSKRVFQTRDANAPNNLFTDVKNGSVFNIRSEITPVDLQDRNLPAYNMEFQRLADNSDQRTFAFEVATGESLPSGTPFRLGALLTQTANSHFKFKREKIGLFIKELIEDFIIPGFKNKNNKPHPVMFTGSSEELTKLDDLIVSNALETALLDFFEKNGTLPSSDQFKQEASRIRENLERSQQRFLDLPAKFYDNLRFNVDVVITGESIDKQAELTTQMNLLSLIASNPNVLQDPTIRGLIESIADIAGFSPVNIVKTPAQTQQQPQLVQEGNVGSPPRPQSINQIFGQSSQQL